MLHRLQVRFLTGLLPVAPLVSRKTVTSILTPSEGTACNWDAFSMREAELWTTPSFSAPSVEPSTGSVRTLFAANAANLPGGRTSQLRKLRSGLCPNKRYPGWTVEQVRRPTLDEAATLVAQLESCEAGLGRTVMEPTTPTKQRVATQAAVLAHWEKVGEAADNENHALQRFDQRRSKLWEAYGLNDQLESKLAPQGWWCSLSQDRLIWQYKSGSIVCSARPKRDFGIMCAEGCDGSSSSESEAEPYNIWNALLAALVHFRIGEVLQPLLTSEEVGCVALSCHFACDALCAELYD